MPLVGRTQRLRPITWYTSSQVQWWEPLPAPLTGTNWYRVTGTCNWNDGPNSWVMPGNETLIGPTGTTYSQCGQSLLLLLLK